MQCTFAPQVIVWYMSIYNQLFILVVELQLKFRERCGGGAKSSGDVTYGPSGKWCSMKEEYRNIGKSNLNNSLFNWGNMLDMQKSLL